MACEIRIKKINMVAFWQYDVENSMCPICQKDLLIPTNQALERRIIRNNIAIGECGHGVHTDCIDRWALANNSCPYCMGEWKLHKNVNSSVCVLKRTSDREKTAEPSMDHSDEEMHPAM